MQIVDDNTCQANMPVIEMSCSATVYKRVMKREWQEWYERG